jgi:hypothetical protein
VVGDTTSNSITYTLPDAALMAGKIIQIAKSVAANTLTVAAASGQLVNGAASVAYTAINSTGVFQSDGSNWYVFQTVGDADTLGGVAADTGTTADTIPVRDENGDLPGDITGNAATATTAGKVVETGASANLNVKILEIGDWNMDTTNSVSIAHGVSSGNTKIKSVSASVRNDADTAVYDLIGGAWASPELADSPSGSIYYTSTDVTLNRVSGTPLDSTEFDSTSFNRGWITIWYTD